MRTPLAARLALLLAACAAPASAAFQSEDAGTASAQFLKLGADARAAGMGNAVRAGCEDASASYWNPAGLAGLNHRHVTLTHAALYQDVFYDFIAFGLPIPSPKLSGRRQLRNNDYGSVAVGLLYLNAGRITELDNTGTPTGGSITPQDLAAVVAWGGELADWLDLGAGGKFVSSRIKGSASTGAVDLGARLKLRLLEAPLILAAGLQNLGGALRYVEQDDPLPTTASLAVSLRPARGWILEMDVAATRDQAPYPAFGTEFRLPIDSSLTAALRAGWSGRLADAGLGGGTGLSFGGGLGLSRFAIDYAWTPFGIIGGAHRMSLSCRF